MSNKRIPGTFVAGLLVPALSLEQFERVADKLNSFEKMAEDPAAAVKAGLLTDAVEIIHAAVSRNYPDKSLEDVKALIDLRNMPEFVAAATGSSVVSKGEDGSPASA